MSSIILHLFLDVTFVLYMIYFQIWFVTFSTLLKYKIFLLKISCFTLVDREDIFKFILRGNTNEGVLASTLPPLIVPMMLCIGGNGKFTRWGQYARCVHKCPCLVGFKYHIMLGLLVARFNDFRWNFVHAKKIRILHIYGYTMLF